MYISYTEIEENRSDSILWKYVIDNEHVFPVTMQELRDYAGHNRLGCHVVSAIGRMLDRLGLKHWPRKLPTSQDRVVILYDRNSSWRRFFEFVSGEGEEFEKEVQRLAERRITKRPPRS